MIEFFFGSPEEHIMCKQVTAGCLIDDPQVQPVARIGTYISVTDEELGRLIEPGGNGDEYPVKMGGIEGLVEVVPVYLGSRHLVFDDKAIFGTSAGEGAGADQEGGCVVEHTLVPAKAMTDEFIWRQRIVNGIGDTKTEPGQLVGRKGNDRD